MDVTKPDAASFLRLFGPLGVEHAGILLPSPASRKTRAMLGYLAMNPRPVTRQRLCDLFFDVPDDPRAAVRWSLSKIRPLLDEAAGAGLVAERDAVRLEPGGMCIDALAVQAIAARPPELLSAEMCIEALDLLRGAFLEDCDLPNRPEYSAWLAAQRQDFQAIARRLATRLAELSSGEERLARLRQLLALDPLNEGAAAALARSLVESGRRDEAHELVARVERHLRQAGLPPGPALRMALRAAPPSEAPAPAPRAAGAESEDGRIGIAVLPFLNHSPDQVSEELMLGLLESTLHMLSKFRDLRVAGLWHSVQLKGALRDPALIGAELGVSHLVGGSAMVRESTLKIRYRVVAANEGTLLCSGDVDHEGVDAAALLEDVPARLVVLLGHHLAEIARRQALARPAAQRTAQDHFLVGIHLAFFAEPLDYAGALDAFEAGLRLEPDHPSLNAYAAWAKAGLGHSLSEPLRAKALAQAHRAMSHAEADADALAIGAWSAVHIAQDFEPALRAVELAVRLNPLSRVAWSASAWVRAMAGEVEAPLEQWDQAQRCNPLDSSIDNTHCGRALCYWMAGRMEEAAASAMRGLERQPGHPAGHMAAVAAAVSMGDAERARRAALAMLAIYPDAPDIAAMTSIPIRDPDTRVRLLAALREGAALAQGSKAGNQA